MSTRGNQVLEQKPWTLLLWTALAGIIFGLIGFGEIAEDWLRVTRNSFHEHKASGQVVVIRIDDEALREFGNWPWPRRTQALLVDKLTAANANRISTTSTSRSGRTAPTKRLSRIARSLRASRHCWPGRSLDLIDRRAASTQRPCRNSPGTRRSESQAFITITKTPLRACPMAR